MAEETAEIDHFVIPTLKTERLRLRSLRRGDIDDYAALNADPEVMRHVGGTWDRSRSWRHLAFLIGHWPLGGSGMWALEQRETGAFVGVVGFAQPEGWPGFELAGKLARRWWGYGYASEAARAALAHAFTVLQKNRVISLVRPDNQASIRLVERLGERLEGRTLLAGTDYLVYGIEREGWALTSGSYRRCSGASAAAPG
jgi:RimJ/RimL family protein N-acetyltransferase